MTAQDQTFGDKNVFLSVIASFPFLFSFFLIFFLRFICFLPFSCGQTVEGGKHERWGIYNEWLSVCPPKKIDETKTSDGSKCGRMMIFACGVVQTVCLNAQEKDPVQFGNFSASVYSMFQVCTGDGWSTDIVRPLFREDGHVDPLAVCFFVSYILLAGYFLLNIIVAVLLDEFVRSVESERSQMAAAKAIEQAKGTQQSQGALDPLLSLLFRYDTSADLRQKINGLYEFLQPEGGDSLTFPQFVSRIGDLIDLPRMHIAREDW